MKRPCMLINCSGKISGWWNSEMNTKLRVDYHRFSSECCLKILCNHCKISFKALFIPLLNMYILWIFKNLWKVSGSQTLVIKSRDWQTFSVGPDSKYFRFCRRPYWLFHIFISHQFLAIPDSAISFPQHCDILAKHTLLIFLVKNLTRESATVKKNH